MSPRTKRRHIVEHGLAFVQITRIPHSLERLGSHLLPPRKSPAGESGRRGNEAISKWVEWVEGADEVPTEVQAYAALGARRAGRTGAILAGVTVALLLPYYGAEAYALHVLGTLDPAQAQAVAQAFRYGPIPMTMFGLGWVALGALAVLTARSLRTPGLASRIALIVHTVAMVAWLPVFFLPPVGRIAHATVLLISAVVLATRAYALPRSAAEPQLTAQPTR